MVRKRTFRITGFAALMMAAFNAMLSSTVSGEEATYELRYKFEPGEVIRWNVSQQARVRTTISGTTQTAETLSRSVKVWRVTEVKDSGEMTVEHSVESIDMKQQVTGREEVRYNSVNGDEPPVEFAEAAKAVGKPLVLITISPRGTVANRELIDESQQKNDGQLLLPMPDGPIKVGDHWIEAHEVEVTQESGARKKIKARQKFTLEDVDMGIATIRVATEILSPIHDPQVEAQVVQLAKKGRVQFDIEKGRMVRQQLDLDERVHGFSGDASVMHYVTRFVEEILPSSVEAAQQARRTAGPALPPSPPADANERSTTRPSGASRKR